jgi:REP element-mobilizing transposase RayT
MRNRRSLRLKEYDYSLTGAYFVTICVHKKESLLGSTNDNSVVLSPIGELTNQCLQQIPDRFDSVELDEYIIMPNHIHTTIIINNDNADTMDAVDNGTTNVGTQLNTPTNVGARFIAPNKRGTDKTLHHKPGFDKSNHYIKNNPMLSDHVTLGKIMRSFKAQSTHMIRNVANYSYFQWQRNYYDHIIRNENELNRIREYIIYNPMKWQYDRENPDHITCNNNDVNLNQIEKIIYTNKT